MKNNSFEIFYNEFISDKNKLKNAYLIETNNVDITCKNLVSVFQKMNYSPFSYDEVINGSDRDIQIIDSNSKSIKKENLDELKKELNSSSSYKENYRFYIIKNAEKLSKSTANLMLKFIEEPPKNVVCFLLISNKYLIMETIRSRMMSFKIVEEQEPSKDAYYFLDLLESDKEIFIINMKDSLKVKMNDNKELIKLLKDMISIIKLNNNYYYLYETILYGLELANDYISYKVVFEKMYYKLYGGKHV